VAVAQHSQQSSGESVRVARRDQETSLTIAHDPAQTATVAGDHRDAIHHRLDGNLTERLLPNRWNCHCPRFAKNPFNFFIWLDPEHRNTGSETKLSRELFNRDAFGTIAANHQSRFGDLLDDFRKCPQQDINTLFPDEPAGKRNGWLA